MVKMREIEKKKMDNCDGRRDVWSHREYDLVDDELQRSCDQYPLPADHHHHHHHHHHVDTNNIHPIKKLRLFGVNIIPINYHHHISPQINSPPPPLPPRPPPPLPPRPPPPQTHHRPITTHDKENTNPNPNPNQEGERHKRIRKLSDDSLQLRLGPTCPPLPKKPKTLRLFGVNIPVHDDQSTSTSSEAQGQGIIVVDQNAENPNADQQVVQVEDEEEDDPHPHGGIIIDEGDPVLLFEKELKSSDVVSEQGRLLISGSKKLMAALTEEERARVEIKGDYVTVVTYTRDGDDGGDEYILHLTKWASKAIVLIHRWNALVAHNHLQPGDSVRGWAYRLRGQFRLLLDIIYQQ